MENGRGHGHGFRHGQEGAGPGSGFGNGQVGPGGGPGGGFGNGGGWSGGAGGAGGGPGGGVGGGSGIRNITALPGAIARGGRLTISVDGCRGGGTASSRAFAPTPLRPFGAAGETARGTATIRFDARPGSYDITADCGGRSLTRPAAFTVVGGVNGGVGADSLNTPEKTAAWVKEIAEQLSSA
ncbi:hypothetical protein ACLMNJ_28845 [Streptomyces seoulensis]